MAGGLGCDGVVCKDESAQAVGEDGGQGVSSQGQVGQYNAVLREAGPLEQWGQGGCCLGTNVLGTQNGHTNCPPALRLEEAKRRAAEEEAERAVREAAEKAEAAREAERMRVQAEAARKVCGTGISPTGMGGWLYAR